MKKLLIISSVALVLFSMTGCKKDFLDISDPNSLNKDGLFSTPYYVDKELTTLYSNLHSISLYGKRYMPKGVAALDKTFDQSYISAPEWNQYFQNQVDPANSILSDAYRDVYKGIGLANDILQNIDLVRNKPDITSDQQHELNLMEAQAKFLRAWHYWVAVNYWGARPSGGGYDGTLGGVCLVTKPITTVDGFNIPVSTNADVYDLIISDLKAAADSLPASWDASNIARVTKWSALALIGKCYLFTQDYTNAVIYLNNVIQNSGKSLVSWNVYKTMFNGQNEFNNESIFEIAIVHDPNTGWGSWDNHPGQMYSMVAGYWTLGADGDPHKAGQTGWNNVFVHDSCVSEFGYHVQPANTNADLFTPAYITATQNGLATSDPRIRVNFLVPIIDTLNWEDGTKAVIAKYGSETVGGDNMIAEKMLCWSIKKYSCLIGSVYSYQVNTSENFYVIRLADVYLMYAEALIKSGGSETTARQYINAVRARAYGNHSHDIASTGAALMTDLKHERFVELFGEGHRWFDICRWGDGPAMAAKFVRTRSGSITFTNPRSYWLPFPESETRTNLALKQHPGGY